MEPLSRMQKEERRTSNPNRAKDLLHDKFLFVVVALAAVVVAIVVIVVCLCM